jgi:diadenosine tetraphosphate (Ap4A) HIT family hydrolase
MDAQCPFCSPVPEEIVLRNPLCYARYDRYPVSKGHVLIVPFRHVSNFFELSQDERKAALELVWEANAKLCSDFHPDGYNVGVNVGSAAGQTVMHVHIHLIPRYQGDVPDPRGGVRFVVPQKAKYCEQSLTCEEGPENENR